MASSAICTGKRWKLWRTEIEWGDVMSEFEGKVVLVTGAAGALGRAVVDHSVRTGARSTHLPGIGRVRVEPDAAGITGHCPSLDKVALP